MRGSAPKRILLAHLADQITDLAVHAGPSQVTCPPPPVEAEAFAMPADHGGYQGVVDAAGQGRVWMMIGKEAGTAR